MRVTKAIKAEQLKLLQEHYFDAKPALEYTNEFELLVAVVLSAQCTDEHGLILLLNDCSQNLIILQRCLKSELLS